MKLHHIALKLFIMTLCLLGSSVHARDSFQNFQVVDHQGLTNHYMGDAVGTFGRGFELDSPIYQMILDELSNQYQRIGERESNNVLEHESGFFVGGLNQIGFRWGTDFVDFQIEVNRQLAPDLFDDHRWIVSDKLDIIIDATKVLSNLADMDLIDLTEDQFAAFAGVKFKRSYRYVHFADSYIKGLTQNFENLFFGFRAFRGQNFLDLEPGEYIKRSDALSFDLGVIASTPLYQTGGINLSGSFGAMMGFAHVSEVDVHAPDFDEDSFLRVSVSKEEITSLGAVASVQIDFLKLLHLTLLSYEYEYSLSEKYTAYLEFEEEDRAYLQQGHPVNNALRELLSLNKGELDTLVPFRVSEEFRRNQEVNSRYMVLFRGGMRNQKTEHLVFKSDSEEKTFFRHNFSRSNYQENFLSRLFSGIIKRIFNLDQNVKEDFKETKSVRMEYESVENLVSKRKDINISDNRDVLSLNFRIDYFANNTRNGLRRKHAERAVEIIGNQSGGDPYIENLILNGFLEGPLNLTARYELGKDAVNYFNNLSSSQKYRKIEDLCSSKTQGTGFFRRLFNTCENSLKNSYEDYELERHHRAITQEEHQYCVRRYRLRRPLSTRNTLVHACLRQMARKPSDVVTYELPLWRLKDFLQKVHLKSDNKIDYYEFFGLQNVFHYGEISAVSPDGRRFHSHFKEGSFHGLGVIENFRQGEGIRSPASAY